MLLQAYGAQAVVVSIDPRRVYVRSPGDTQRPCVRTCQLGPEGEEFCWWQCTVKVGSPGLPSESWAIPVHRAGCHAWPLCMVGAWAMHQLGPERSSCDNVALLRPGSCSVCCLQACWPCHDSASLRVQGGREGRDLDATELAQAAQALGAGELLLNCIDRCAPPPCSQLDYMVDPH